MELERGSGILMHITSLPSPYGIGTLGEAAFRFVDFLTEAGQRYWQVLPMGMTGYGNSPYQSCSAFAGNINLIDLDILARQGYLRPEDYQNIDWGTRTDRVDYGKIYENRGRILAKAPAAFATDNAAYCAFCEENRFWLDDFALFMAIKEQYDMRSLDTWEPALRRREPKAIKTFQDDYVKDIERNKILQYWFYDQLAALRQYTHSKGISLIGDIPFYVAFDSADVWAHPELFNLDEELNPISVAGVPPDAFSDDGQLWGNPIYNYKAMRTDGYAWWRSRIAQSFVHCDVLRIDHFRAFHSYYVVSYGNPNARNGEWLPGEGMAMLNALGLKELRIIAEDLGNLGDDIREFVRRTGLPNMKVLQFAFDSNRRNAFLPSNYDENCVVYTGTHDNNTTRGWYASALFKQRINVACFAPHSLFRRKSEAFIQCAQRSRARIAIIPMQDYLDSGRRTARMNLPSTTFGNWEWRAHSGGLQLGAVRIYPKALCRTSALNRPLLTYDLQVAIISI